MIDKIKTMIIELCDNNSDWDWKGHVEDVVKYSKILANDLGADEEICEISAWMHDIVKIQGQKDNHHILGADEAERILLGLNYPKAKITKIKQCIITHSSDSKYMPESTEAKIVASSDALSHFVNFLRLSHIAFGVKGLSLKEGNLWMAKKYEGCWKKLELLPESQKYAIEKYKIIKIILNE